MEASTHGILVKEQASISSGNLGALKNLSRKMKGRGERKRKRLEKLGRGNFFPTEIALYFLKKKC